VRTTTVERAFELARSGALPTIGAIAERLTREGYSLDQIDGRLRREIRTLLEDANGIEGAALIASSLETLPGREAPRVY